MYKAQNPKATLAHSEANGGPSISGVVEEGVCRSPNLAVSRPNKSSALHWRFNPLQGYSGLAKGEQCCK